MSPPSGTIEGAVMLNMTMPAAIESPRERRDTPDPLTTKKISGTVLIVDDDETLLRSLARLLRLRGYEPKTATSAAAAIELVQTERFDVVLSDIAMPGMDGIELLRNIRDTDLVVPVILITGAPAVSTAVDAVEYGAFRYLTKPVENDDLVATVEKAVRYHRMARMKARAAELLGTETAGPGDRAGLEVSFERALETLWIAYQPIVDARNRRVFGHEALLRSSEPSLPHPGAVIDAALRLEQLDVLGRSIRARAAGPVAENPAAGALFVNLHVRDLLDPTLTAPESPLSRIASRVVLEITERAALDEVGDVRPRIARLREMGFRIAIDDLGAGYIDSSATKQKVVRSMSSLCRDMGMLVVAEGVETPAERDALVELGCDLLQGYFFAKPSRPFPQISW
ncbi:MAG: EAL domain-containing protein [Sorangiineae bacterium PRO1]|nr:EAL domain-containing protein [Sorangiineae bacterium PRO1]